MGGGDTGLGIGDGVASTSGVGVVADADGAGEPFTGGAGIGDAAGFGDCCAL